MVQKCGRIMMGGILMSLTLFGAGSWAQLPEFRMSRYEGAPRFHFRAQTLKGEQPDRSEVRVSVQITNDELQFLQLESGFFRAEFEVTILIRDMEERQIEMKTLSEKVMAGSYRETNSLNHYSLVQRAFDLEPGEYILQIFLVDKDSKKQVEQKAELEVPGYSEGHLMMSDIFLANDVSVDSSGLLRSFPNIKGNFGNKQDMVYAWFEIYNPEDLDSVRVISRILNYEDKKKREWENWKTLLGANTVYIMELHREDLLSGKYTLEVELENGERIEKRTNFSINWTGMMAVAADLEKATEQLKYIASTSELKKIKNAPSGEKEEQFREFWKGKDPTPNTERNELMEEYYRRVSYANSAFGKYTEGWKTDRGMIYIILGPPDDLERFPHNPDTKPYEIWYYAKAHYLPLFFVDESGFGEYRMTQDSWQRFYQIR